MFKNPKVNGVFTILIFVIVIIGFVLILTRKQTVAANGEVKSSWKKTENPQDE